jgi:hypothetical protein
MHSVKLTVLVEHTVIDRIIYIFMITTLELKHVGRYFNINLINIYGVYNLKIF